MTAFATPIDIADKALMLLGARTLSEQSITTAAGWAASTDLGATTALIAYDKARQSELRRHLWRFAARRAVIRPITATTQLLVFGTYNAGTSYSAGDVVVDSAGKIWTCILGGTGHTPSAYSSVYWEEGSLSFTMDSNGWSSTTTYYAGEIVISGGSYYVGISGSNLNHIPPNATYWLLLTTQPTANILPLNWPLGNFQQSTGGNYRAFFNPVRFLRLLPQDPKAPGVVNQRLGQGQQWSDLDKEGPYFITGIGTNPLFLRYAADVELVPRFDPLFCEGIAARMARDMAPRIDPTRFDLCQKIYDGVIREARVIDALESGATDREDDALPPVPQASQLQGPGGMQA